MIMMRRRHTWPFELFDLDTVLLENPPVAEIVPVNNKTTESEEICKELCQNVSDPCTCCNASETIDNETRVQEQTDDNKNDKEKKSSDNYQPIQDKFSFLTKKSRDSRKKRRDSPVHSKVCEVKSISPTGKSDSSILTNKSDSHNYYSNCNSTPSHNSNLSNSTASNHSCHSHCCSTNCSQSLRSCSSNCKSNIGGNSSDGGRVLSRNSASKTSGRVKSSASQGKIALANGTATGALSLHVNTPNGDVKKVITLWQNYYPEGQWGYIVVFCALIIHAINHGIQLSFSTFSVFVKHKFSVGEPALLVWLGSLSLSVSLFLSPLSVSICKKKSTRLSAVFGGLISALGCLFTSFAVQFHQLFLSYGVVLGVGVGLSRDAASLMVGQYFKRKRELVEIVVVSGSGLGIIVMSISLNSAISAVGWRLGLQVMTGMLFLTFFLGTCYLSASLYHPQRRAILHLKNQKKKVKDLSRKEEKPPFIDYSCLKSKTLQILLLSSAFTAFGINTPLFYLMMECEDMNIDQESFLLLQVYIGSAWIIGCCLFGLIVVQKNQECRVSKQYLCQVASVIAGISIVSLTAVKGLNGLIIFTWVYGFSLGGYSYALKVYTYERVRARHFPRAWSFIQWSQAVPIFLSIPFTSYINEQTGKKTGKMLLNPKRKAEAAPTTKKRGIFFWCELIIS